MSASTVRTLLAEEVGNRVGQLAAGASIRRSASRSSARVADPPCDADRREPVGVRGDDVERAVADHHRARRAERARARARASRSSASARASSVGPAITSKCSRRPDARRAAARRTPSAWTSRPRAGGRRRAARAPRGCRLDRRVGQRRRRVALAVGVDHRRDLGRPPAPARAARRTSARSAGRCRRAARARLRSGGRAAISAWFMQPAIAARESTSTPSRSKITVVAIAQDPLRVLPARSRRRRRACWHAPSPRCPPPPHRRPPPAHRRRHARHVRARLGRRRLGRLDGRDDRPPRTTTTTTTDDHDDDDRRRDDRRRRRATSPRRRLLDAHTGQS